MKIVAFLLSLSAVIFAASPDDAVYLIVRADDIGSSHAANLACIESYQNGIARSVEVMVPCPWFLEAAEMLRDNPGYDVGVHLTLTSEWANVKWGPLTCAPSLVDSNGYFYPKQKNWQDENAQDAFWNAGPDVKEFEAEIRAQIETAKKHIPQVSHVSAHMGAATISPELAQLTAKIAAELNVDIDLRKFNVGRVKWNSPLTDDAEKRTQKLIAALQELTPGLYLIVEHPGLDVPEMHGLGHPGYENVAEHRDGVTKAFTDARVKKVIADKNIRLISYNQAQEMFGR